VTLRRRSVLHLAAGAAALALSPRLARAQSAPTQNYPSRPVRLIAGFPAGSAPDLVARLAGQWLSDTLGQPFVIENRPGAASNIGTEAVARSAPDGYTLLASVLTNVFNTTLYTNLSFNFASDFVHVAGVANAPYVLIVPLSFPAKTVPEFIAYAKANPGKINMASGGKGSSSHIFGELFKSMAGVEIVHVPYRANYMPDLMAGEVHMAVNPMPQALELIRSGKIRALGVTTKARQASLPDVPTVAESVPGYEALGWYALAAPKGTPTEIVDKLNAAMATILVDPKFKERLADLGVEPMPMTPAEFSKFIATETDKWTKVIKAAGVVLE
jgi:tripartite-type tricarboxylate transporter receptor subunit TctC